VKGSIHHLITYGWFCKAAKGRRIINIKEANHILKWGFPHTCAKYHNEIYSEMEKLNLIKKFRLKYYHLCPA
jgi:hypothetical protein